MKATKIDKVSLPCLRGRMGDWIYYSTMLKFSEIAKRVKLPREINRKYAEENLKLNDWIQREIVERRISSIVEYLYNQEQRFFNSLILGIYDGKPAWQEIQLKADQIYKEQDLDYLNKTFGILTLEGSESIFAIDGQHRAYGIRKAVKKYPELGHDEVSVILIAHKITQEGHIRTRRLFSTLNRYAKPVSKSEIIALSEDDNSAILTRTIIEKFSPFRGKILISKSKSINPQNRVSFTTIVTLYDIIERIFTDKSIPGYGKVKGYKRKEYSYNRVSEEKMEEDFKLLMKIFNKLIREIPSLFEFFKNNNEINRDDLGTSLLFRPIGLNILFDVLKAGFNENKENLVYNFFKKDDFNMKHAVWSKVFWDKDTGEISTEKSRQRYATILILEYLGFKIRRTPKDKEIYANFGINIIELN